MSDDVSKSVMLSAMDDEEVVRVLFLSLEIMHPIRSSCDNRATGVR